MRKITMAGKSYPVEIKEGVRYIDGLTVDQFLATLPKDVVEDMALAGMQHIENEKTGTKPFTIQEMVNDLHSKKHN